MKGKKWIAFAMIASIVSTAPVHVYTKTNTNSVETQAVAQKLKSPVLSKKSGTYTEAIKVTIKNAEKQGKIYYTTNGKTPTKQSQRYTKAITIKKDCTLKAICIKGNQKSSVVTRVYKITTDQSESTYLWGENSVAAYVDAIQQNRIDSLGKTGQAICKAAKELLQKEIKVGMSREEQAKAIHDAIIQNTAYDIENLEANTLPDSAYSVEGVLLNHSAVCQGYAETYQLFMELLDIPNKLVTGTLNGIPHAWNMVQLSDGQWYYVDCTSDDPITYDGAQVLRYHYLFTNDSIMKENYVWESEKYPACHGTQYLYYGFEHKLKSITDAYDEIAKQYKAGQKEITVLYPEKESIDVERLMQKLGVSSIGYIPAQRLGDYTIFTVNFE